jgi:hypothetical protein
MRELSSGPEAHLFRTPGSPLAERREGHRLSPAFPLSGAKGECCNEPRVRLSTCLLLFLCTVATVDSIAWFGLLSYILVCSFKASSTLIADC